MITTNKTILSESGTVLNFHNIYESSTNLATGVVTISIGSCELSDTPNKPDKITEILVKYPSWKPEYYDALEETVMLHPDWSGQGPKKPYPDYLWYPLTLSWGPPPYPPIEELKATKWAEIKQAGIDCELSSFVWNGSVFDSNSVSQQRIYSAAQMAILDPNYTVDWTLANNTIRSLSAEDVKNLAIALNTHINDCHQKSQSLRNKIDSATTVQQIKDIVW